MKTLKACICDDDRAILPTYCASVKECFRNFGVACDVDSFSDTRSLKNRMAEYAYDVVFLDIDMRGDTDGITVADEIRSGENPIPIIFVSAREDKMYDTFKVRPFGFVRKSNFLNDLSSTIELFMKAYPELYEEPVVFVTVKGTYRLESRQIVYVESFLHNQDVHLSDKSEIELHSTMDAVFKQLEEKGFIRVHKSYIVNYRYIEKIEDREVLLTTGDKIPMSRNKKNEVKSLWLDYGTKNGFTYI